MNNNITANFNSNNANNNNHLVGQKEFQEYHPQYLDKRRSVFFFLLSSSSSLLSSFFFDHPFFSAADLGHSSAAVLNNLRRTFRRGLHRTHFVRKNEKRGKAPPHPPRPRCGFEGQGADACLLCSGMVAVVMDLANQKSQLGGTVPRRTQTFLTQLLLHGQFGRSFRSVF